MLEETNVTSSGGETHRCGKSSDTLLGFETTSPLSLRPVVGDTGGRLRPPRVWGVALLVKGLVVVALLWWWGVVFDLWIVVASISHVRAPASSGVGVFVCGDNAIFDSSENF